MNPNLKFRLLILKMTPKTNQNSFIIGTVYDIVSLNLKNSTLYDPRNFFCKSRNGIQVLLLILKVQWVWGKKKM